jgi:cysteine synthase
MNILDHIGNTPLVKLNHVNETPEVEIYVKCEYMNPGGSYKDRMALEMIEAAERRGDLKPGGTIVDQSTGNTGPALSFVGNVKGYNVQLFLPSQLGSAYNPVDRIRIAKLFGCTVTSIDLGDHMDGIDALNPIDKAAAYVAIRMAQCYKFAQNDPTAWWSNQLCNPDNTVAHFKGTGREIVEQMGDKKIDAWVASMGTGGALLGVADAIKLNNNPKLHVSGILPTDDARIDWVRTRAVHKFLKKFGVPDLRFVLEDVLEQDTMDDEITVENTNAIDMANRLCSEEGFFCGMSSGANVYAAVQKAKTMPPGSKIVTVLVDRRDRYAAEYPNEHYVV